jgi:hypothetical protein
MRLSKVMKLAAIALAGLTAWGTSLAHAGEAPPEDPSVSTSAPAPAAPSPEPPRRLWGTSPAEVPPEPPVSVPAPAPAPAVPPQEPPVRVATPAPAVPPASARHTWPTRPPPGPVTGSSSEGGIGALQVFVGILGTFFTGLLVSLVAAGTDSSAVALVGVLGTPAVGGLVVCGVGQTSKHYEGGCGPPILGAYLGALGLGLAMAYVGEHEFAPSGGSDGDNTGEVIGIVLGAALGVLVGTAVGATIAWHVSKHPREDSVALAYGPPPPPPAALGPWADLEARSGAARAPAVVGVPLLSLRF